MSDDKPYYAGHRARLRERLCKDSSGLADYEIIELLLGYGMLRKDTKPIAKELLKRFGNVRGVLEAFPAELQDIPGFGKGLTVLLILQREIWARCAEASTRNRESLCTPENVAKMAVARLGGCPHEELWIATVDAQNRQLSWERLSKGTVDEAPCYARDIVEVALQRKASGFILVHNHPGGTPGASPADLENTQYLERIAKNMNLRLLDHIILGDGVCYSICNKKLI